MKQTINIYQFREAFAAMDRKDQFSYDGLQSLFDYLEDQSEDIGEELELDVIGLCCDFAEASYQDIARDYGINIDALDEEGAREAVLDYLEDRTIIIDASNDLIVYCSTF